MKQLSISFLGSLEINLDNVPVSNFAYDKVWALLVYLIVESHQVHHREFLAALLWPDFPSERARSNLRQTLATLRQILGDRAAEQPFLLTTRQTIQFNTDSRYQSDLSQFLVYLEAVAWPLADHLSLEDIVRLEQALTCYKGEFLANTVLPVEEPFEEWVMFTRTKLQQQAIDICHSLVTHYEQQQQWSQALQYAHRSLELEPWNELMHQSIMRVSTYCGQRSAAIKQYQACCQILESQLAIMPDPITTALYEQIQNGDIAIKAQIPLIQNELIAVQPATEMLELGDAAAVTSEIESPPPVISEQGLDLTTTKVVESCLEPIAPLMPKAITKDASVAIEPQTVIVDLVADIDSTQQQSITPEVISNVISTIPENRYYCRNRSKMLEKVQVFWIKGVLENSLHNALMIELGLETRSVAIEQPWNLLTQLSDQTQQRLPDNTKILDVYDQVDRSLLILGDPGAGKTTLLLDLARALLVRATQDLNHPMPVVFNLSSWAKPSSSISSWLIEELQVRYQVPKQLAQQWIEEAKILPLLDGLDEVVAEQREACVQAINQFRSDYWLTDLVVCSRVNDYDALASKLQLNDAVLVQHLSLSQIDQYLEQLGDRLLTVQKAMHQNWELQELMQTPLMLSILVLVYQDSNFTLSLSESSADWRKNLFTAYIQRMLRHRGVASEYDDRAVDWLTWLANALTQRNQSMFFIEQVQPDLLFSDQQRLLLSIIETSIVAISVGVVGGMGVGVHHASLAGWADGLWPWVERSMQGLIQGAGVGLLTGFSTSVIINLVTIAAQFFLKSQTSHPEYRWLKLWLAMRFGAATGVSQGAAVVFFLGYGLGLADGFLVALTSGIAALKFLESGQIRLFEAWHWSWERARLGIVPGSLLGMLFGVIYGVGYGIEYAIVLAPTVWMITITGFGLTNSEIETRVVPNQGIYDTAKGALRVSLAISIPYALANVIGCGLSVDWPSAIGNGFSAAVTLGLCCWLICGGFACIQHLIIRGILYKSGVIPWNYAAFLDYAVEKTFLRRVGGGYVFLHRLLLEYFAGLNASQLIDNEHNIFLLETNNQQPAKLD
jgi:eukaryotic-like serine/threonine-protein kinase